VDRLSADLAAMFESAEDRVRRANQASVDPDVPGDLIAGRIAEDSSVRFRQPPVPPLKLVAREDPSTPDTAALAGHDAADPDKAASIDPPRRERGDASSHPPYHPLALARLRRRFRRYVRLQDYDAALTIGEQIVRGYPTSVAAAEFLRVRCALVDRVNSSVDPDGTSPNGPPPMVVQAGAATERTGRDRC